MWFSADSQGLDAGKIENISIKISDQLSIGWFPLIVFLIAIVVIAALRALPRPHQAGQGLPGHVRRP